MRINRFFQKYYAFILVLVVCMMLLPVSAAAAGAVPTVSVSGTEVPVDQTDGSFRFHIAIDAPENYAGAEFGVICSQGTEITAVSAAGGSVTGPQKANGLVWFGFFDGEDSFSGTTTVTVEGTCEIGTDCAVVIQDVSIYTIGDEVYASTDVASGIVVNLRCEPVETQPPASQPDEETETWDIDVLAVCLLVIAAVVAGTLIYRKHKQTNIKKENEYAS